MTINNRSLCTCGHPFESHAQPLVRGEVRRVDSSGRFTVPLPAPLAGACRVDMGTVYDRGRDLRDTKGRCPCVEFELETAEHRNAAETLDRMRQHFPRKR